MIKYKNVLKLCKNAGNEGKGMKLIHLSDLHLGKRVNEFSMIEDQSYILREIIRIIDEENPDGVIIAGDIYDKSIPSEEAVSLWDDFLNMLATRKLEVYVISGNHDSAVRVSEMHRIVDAAGIHLSPAYDGNISCHTFSDKYGDVNIYLLPFIKPANVRAVFPDEKIESYTDAVRVALEKGAALDDARRNVLVAHQFVTGASRCESEEITIGGLDNVDASVFDGFDYVALGHIHGPQYVSKENIRYCGTPLKYSFSEKDHHKAVTAIELRDKGDCEIRKIELKPMRDLRQIKGTYDEVTDKRNYDGTDTNDYVHIVLTDEEDIPDAIGKLRVIYPNLMKLSYDNARTKENRVIEGSAEIEKKSPIDLFEEFYELQNNQEMSDEQRELVQELIENIWR